MDVTRSYLTDSYNYEVRRRLEASGRNGDPINTGFEQRGAVAAVGTGGYGLRKTGVAVRYDNLRVRDNCTRRVCNNSGNIPGGS